jgi:NAD(P) transhydrogenase subunit alpha
MDPTQIMPVAETAVETAANNSLIALITVFVLAIFVGYYVVWNVTAALHSPLMSVTNAISSVIIVGALIASGPIDINFSKVMGFLAVVLASVNIFGGFIVSQRMLQMFRKKG